jgi:hypothetical protein
MVVRAESVASVIVEGWRTLVSGIGVLWGACVAKRVSVRCRGVVLNSGE